MINWLPRNSKPNAFSLLSTDHGVMIVNRFDYNVLPNNVRIGVSANLFEYNSFDHDEMNLMIKCLQHLRENRGPGVVMIDAGANIGAHSLVAGRQMYGWGTVHAFEAQERIFHCLAGNIALNNLFNVYPKWLALSNKCEILQLPVPNYLKPGSFGSLEMIQTQSSENIGQTIDPTSYQPVQAITIDSLNLNRLDFYKIDVEAMEELVLAGSVDTITKFKPVIHIENMKSNKDALHKTLTNLGYNLRIMGPNTLAVPVGDKIETQI